MTLTVRQAAVLRELRLFQVPPTVAEVADAMGMPRSSAASAVSALLGKGVVELCGSALSGGSTYRAVTS